MNQLIKTNVTKFLPLVILYLLIMVMFLGESSYEAMITITAAIPLVVYIFNKDVKVAVVLKCLLYIFSAALIFYLYNLIMIDTNWFYFCQRNYYAESTWGILKWNNFFVNDLKYLIYLGVIFLAIKTNHVGDEKFRLFINNSVKYINNKLITLSKSRAMRFIVLSYAYLLILIFVVAIILPFVDPGSSFNRDYLETVIWMIPLLLTALYILLYKKRWIVLPAKILFFIILVIAIVDRLYVIYISGLDLATIIPLLVSLVVLTWPLAHLYRSNIKTWFKPQKKGLINNS